MLFVVDAQSVFRKLLERARKEQSKVFKTCFHVGPNSPINNYVKMFDTLIRIMRMWQTIEKRVKEIYDVDEIAIIKSDLVPIVPVYYTYTDLDRRIISDWEFRGKVGTLIWEYDHHPLYFSEEAVNYFETVRKVFGLPIWFMNENEVISDYSICAYGKKQRLRLIRKLLNFYSTFQTRLTVYQHEYIYRMFCSSFKYYCLDENCDGCLVMTMNRWRFKRYKCEVINVDLNLFKTFKKSKCLMNIADNPKEQFESIKEVCDKEIGMVLDFSDTNAMAIINDVEKTYIECVHSRLADALAYPASFKRSHYENFSPLFIKAASILEGRANKLLLQALRV